MLIGSTLRETSERLGSRLAEETYDALFLGYQKDLEPYLERIAEGEACQKVVTDLMKSGLIREPRSYWIKYNVPILEGLSELGMRDERPRIHCITEKHDYDRSVELTDEFLGLYLQARVTDEIDLEAWKRLLREDARHRIKTIAKAGRRIAVGASRYTLSLAVFGYLVRFIKTYLENEGYRVELVYLDPLPFALSPLRRLREKMVEQFLGKRRVLDDELSSDISSHLAYLDCVLRSRSLDEAHRRWFLERASVSAA